LPEDASVEAADQSIRGIVLNVDSPGGEANGIAEFAQSVRAVSASKPVVSYAGDLMASAALWIAAAARQIVLSPTAVIGSIGAVAVGTDTTQRDAMAGVRRYTIRSAQSPLKGHGADSELGRGQMQAVVDALAERFVAAIAAFRRVSIDTMLRDFGQGGFVARPSDAIRVGLADREGRLGALIAELAGKPATVRGAGARRESGGTRGGAGAAREVGYSGRQQR